MFVPSTQWLALERYADCAHLFVWSVAQHWGGSCVWPKFRFSLYFLHESRVRLEREQVRLRSKFLTQSANRTSACHVCQALKSDFHICEELCGQYYLSRSEPLQVFLHFFQTQTPFILFCLITFVLSSICFCSILKCVSDLRWWQLSNTGSILVDLFFMTTYFTWLKQCMELQPFVSHLAPTTLGR